MHRVNGSVIPIRQEVHNRNGSLASSRSPKSPVMNPTQIRFNPPSFVPKLAYLKSEDQVKRSMALEESKNSPMADLLPSPETPNEPRKLSIKPIKVTGGNFMPKKNLKELLGGPNFFEKTLNLPRLNLQRLHSSD